MVRLARTWNATTMTVPVSMVPEMSQCGAVVAPTIQIGTVPEGDLARAASCGGGRDRWEEGQERCGDDEGDRVADDHELVGGERAHLNDPACQHGTEGDADVGHRTQVGPELLRPVPSV